MEHTGGGGHSEINNSSNHTDTGGFLPLRNARVWSECMTFPGICSTTVRAPSLMLLLREILLRSTTMYWLLYVPEIQRGTSTLSCPMDTWILCVNKYWRDLVRRGKTTAWTFNNIIITKHKIKQTKKNPKLCYKSFIYLYLLKTNTESHVVGLTHVAAC